MKTIEDIRNFKPSKEFVEASDKMVNKLQKSIEAVFEATDPLRIDTEFQGLEKIIKGEKNVLE